MPIIQLDPQSPDAETLKLAAEILRAGGLVAFATETVYGLGANALNAAAVKGIYAAKGRPSFNPLIVHVENAAAAQQIVSCWPETASKLAEQFWPGPLTFVLPKREFVPDEVTAGLGSVAVRAPAHPLAQALLRAGGLPIAAPSANRFTELSPTTAAHVAKAFGDELLVLDGGDCSVGIESTVLDLSGDAPTLLRPGGISRAAIEAIIGPIALVEKKEEGDAPRRSPGMIERHYAPRAQLVLVTADRLASAVASAISSKQKTGILQLGAAQQKNAGRVVQMPASPGEYARLLYAALHALDDAGFDTVIVEAPPRTSEWAGIHDRLARASK